MTTTSSNKAKHVAILLAGNGVYDGSECTEAVSMILHLERCGCTFQAFAPNKNQVHTINHTDGSSEEKPARNVMVESARIVRGKIQDVNEFDVTKFEALVVPGGFGAVKNLCTYAIDGVDAYKLDDGVSKMLEACLSTKTVIGLSCIAPMLLPLSSNKNIKFTVGKSTGDEFPYKGTVTDAIKLTENDNNIIECDNKNIVIDEENKVVTAPAYMQDSSHYDVYLNIGQMIDAVVTLMG